MVNPSGCRSHVTIRTCGGAVWQNVPAYVTATEHKIQGEPPNPPVIQAECAATVPAHFNVWLGDTLEFGGLKWRVKSATKVESWGHTLLGLASSTLGEPCEQVEVRQWNRHYGCEQADQAELTHQTRAVIHHMEARTIKKLDGMLMEHTYRIYLDPSVADVLTAGHHIVAGTRVFDIVEVRYLTEAGRIPFVEATSNG